MEINTDPKNLPQVKDKNTVYELINEKAKQTDNVKNAIDLLATKTALEQQGTVEKLVNEKTDELKNNAEAKRVEAETERIAKEVEKVLAEKKKDLAEFDKQIEARKKEVEQLKADSDKAEAFFESNKEILKYIGIRNKKSMNVMKTLMFPATIIFVIVQILLFPLTFVGITLEAIVNIVGGICGSIKNNAFKIIISIAVVVLVLAVFVGVYLLGGKLLIKK